MEEEVLIENVRDLGKLVRKARYKLDMNQETFGALIGVHRNFVSAIENGKPTARIGLALEALRAAGWDLVAVRR